MIICAYLRQFRSELLLKTDIFQTNVVKKIQTHTFYSITSFQKSYHSRDDVEKYFRPIQLALLIWHAICMPDN